MADDPEAERVVDEDAVWERTGEVVAVALSELVAVVTVADALVVAVEERTPEPVPVALQEGD